MYGGEAGNAVCGTGDPLISPSPLSLSKESPREESVCAREEGKKALGGRKGGGGEVGKDH